MFIDVYGLHIKIKNQENKEILITDTIKTLKESMENISYNNSLSNEIIVEEYTYQEQKNEKDDYQDIEVVEDQRELLGKWRITAYCSCSICCGMWADPKYRPDGIVRGASGEELIAGISVASSLPFGTVIDVEGLGEYIVQDRMAQWVIDKYGDSVDIYFDNHDEACNFGLRHLNVYIVGLSY